MPSWTQCKRNRHWGTIWQTRWTPTFQQTGNTLQVEPESRGNLFLDTQGKNLTGAVTAAVLGTREVRLLAARAITRTLGSTSHHP